VTLLLILAGWGACLAAATWAINRDARVGRMLAWCAVAAVTVDTVTVTAGGGALTAALTVDAALIGVMAVAGWRRA